MPTGEQRGARRESRPPLLLCFPGGCGIGVVYRSTCGRLSIINICARIFVILLFCYSLGVGKQRRKVRRAVGKAGKRESRRSVDVGTPPGRHARPPGSRNNFAELRESSVAAEVSAARDYGQRRTLERRGGRERGRRSPRETAAVGKRETIARFARDPLAFFPRLRQIFPRSRIGTGPGINYKAAEIDSRPSVVCNITYF